MTGQAAGFCAGYGMPGYANPAFRRGLGRNRSFRAGGRGWRNCYYATGMPGWMRFGGHAAPCAWPSPDAEKQALKSEADAIRSELEAIEKRLAELEANSASK
ncbi:MAG: DUF5320 domain-containing protein [candidate division WOR-3 bacterium]